MITVDFDKLVERSDELVDYDGKLPLLVRAIIMKKWTDNLNRKGLYAKIIKECVDTKPHTYDEAVRELNNWCEENTDYKDFIKKE